MQSNDIDVQTRMIAEIICAVFIGSPLVIALGIAGFVFPIIGTLKANKDKVRQYPFPLQSFCAAKDLHD